MLERKDIEHIARIARIRLGDGEGADVLRELNSILELIDRMRAVDVSAVETMSHVLDRSQPLRADRPSADIDRERLLGNAPERDGDLFAVPKVIE